MLELEGIRAGYGPHNVLEDVDLVVPDGAVVALLGSNGVGKTTLLRVASGLLAPTKGRLLVDDTDVTTWTADRLARAGVCHVPEGRGIFPNLTVADNLRLQSPPSRRTDLEVVLHAFPRLRQRLDQVAGTLSGGEQQMLALARAYISSPRAILLDEVSMGLAPRIVDDIFQHLRVLATSGPALLIVEQYAARALELADYVYVLRKGQIDFAGEPDELGDDAILASYLGEAV